MDSGLTSTRGSVSSTKWTATELLDTVAWRGVDGGRGYGEGVAAMASAMAGACEGEELERRGGVWGVRGREGGRFTALAGRGRRRGGEQVRGTHAVLAVEHLPACLAGKQLAGAALGWAGRWAGLQAPGKSFLSVFFLFLFFCNFVELLKIPRQLLKSPNCSWSKVGIFPT